MMSENFELNQTPETNTNSAERVEKFEKIKTPEELLLFMKSNIKYMIMMCQHMVAVLSNLLNK